MTSQQKGLTMNDSKDVAERIALHLYRFRDRVESEQDAVKAIAEICNERSWILRDIFDPQPPAPAMPLPPTEDSPF